jgi:hypothetical protein
MKVGDLIRMLPANYSSPGGPKIKDQWAGLLGILTHQYPPPDTSLWVAMVRHPLDDVPSEIIVKDRHMEVVKNEL